MADFFNAFPTHTPCHRGPNSMRLRASTWIFLSALSAIAAISTAAGRRGQGSLLDARRARRLAAPDDASAEVPTMTLRPTGVAATLEEVRRFADLIS